MREVRDPFRGSNEGGGTKNDCNMRLAKLVIIVTGCVFARRARMDPLDRLYFHHNKRVARDPLGSIICNQRAYRRLVKRGKCINKTRRERDRQRNDR